jgi:DNA-binding transcriptional regulator YiaG
MSGHEFRKVRQKMGLSQEELSRLIDVSARGVRRWENGEVAIPKIAELALRYLAELALRYLAEKSQRKENR